MKNILIKNGVQVEDAIDLFSEIIMANGFEYHTVKEFNERVFLKHMTDPMGWLSSWMLRSDELSALITGSRLWDAYYVRNSEAMRLMTSVNKSSLKDDLSIAAESYNSYPLSDDIGVPLSLKYAICNLAFNETLVLYPGKQVDVKITNGFYDLKKPLEDGEILPFQSPTHLTAFYLNKHIFEVNQEKVIGIDLSKNLD